MPMISSVCCTCHLEAMVFMSADDVFYYFLLLSVHTHTHTWYACVITVENWPFPLPERSTIDLQSQHNTSRFSDICTQLQTNIKTGAHTYNEKKIESSQRAHTHTHAHRNDTMTWQDFHLDKQRCKTALCPTHLVRNEDITCCRWGRFTLVWGKNEHLLLCVGHSGMFFLQGGLHTKCSPTCLASSGEHNSVFTHCPLYTSHSNLFKSHFSAAYGKRRRSILVIVIFLVPAHFTCLLELVENSHHGENWSGQMIRMNRSSFCRQTMLNSECQVIIDLVQPTVKQSAHQSLSPKSFKSQISYIAQCSSQTWIAFLSHLKSGNNFTTLITLYWSCTCLTVIYILVFLTSPTIFLSIYHPHSCSHSRLTSPIFPLPSNCHANRRAVFHTIPLSPLIIIFYILCDSVCVFVLNFSTNFILQKTSLTFDIRVEIQMKCPLKRIFGSEQNLWKFADLQSGKCISLKIRL